MSRDDGFHLDITINTLVIDISFYKTDENLTFKHLYGNCQRYYDGTWYVKGYLVCEKNKNKLTKLGDAIAISKSETITDQLTDRGNC